MMRPGISVTVTEPVHCSARSHTGVTETLPRRRLGACEQRALSHASRVSWTRRVRATLDAGVQRRSTDDRRDVERSAAHLVGSESRAIDRGG